MILDTPTTDSKGKQGPCWRERLENLEEQGVKDPKREGFGLDNGFAPEGGETLWDWFWDLNKGRKSGFGVEHISYGEMKDWREITQNRPSLWEIKVLRAMDDAWMEAFQKFSQKGSKSGERKK